MKILLIGGAGYIGSHTYAALCLAGIKPVILDDFSNSHRKVINRLEQITECPVQLEVGDVLDQAFVYDALCRHEPAGVIHFAGFKAVGESTATPLKYFNNNIGGAISLLRAMEAAYLPVGRMGPPTLVFSSSATVYGVPVSVPITEDFPRSHTNPYGYTKFVIEDMLQAIKAAAPAWRVGVLRYFNPVGAHPSGLIGEHPAGLPSNLMPYVAQVAMGLRPYVQVFGSDYATVDGTGVRDYIHVQDLAAGHVSALHALLNAGNSFTLNLGTGRGYSVLEVIRTFERVSGRPVPLRIGQRRPGDVAACYANATLAEQLLGWHSKHSLDEMCEDVWRWQCLNPAGYDTD